MSVSLTSSGLAMPASQSASGDANTLDDYEEGTYSPAITGTGGAGSGVGFTNRLGLYTLVGRIVKVMIHVNQSGWSSGPSGNLYVSLPSNAVNSYSCGAALGYMSNWSKYPKHGIVSGGSDRLYLYTNDASSSTAPTLGTGLTNVTAGDMLATSEIYTGAVYAR